MDSRPKPGDVVTVAVFGLSGVPLTIVRHIDESPHGDGYHQVKFENGNVLGYLFHEKLMSPAP